MSKKQPPRVQLNFEPDYEPPPQNEVDIDIQDVDVQDIDMMPQVVEREKINEKDIFDNIETDTNEETGETNPNFIYEKITVEKPEPEPEPEPVVKKAKPQAKQSVKDKKPRKPMSEAHKAKLALAREKAMIARKAKAEERKKMKALEKEEKELLKQQKVKKVAKLKKEVEEPEPEPQQVTQNISNVSGLTRKDLEDAQFDAIVKYETLRKQRKAEKKQQQALEQSKKELLNKLQPKEYRYRDGSNRWDMCY